MGKKIPMWQILIVMAFTVAAICYAMFVSGSDVHIPLLASAVVASVVAVANGYKWSYLERGIVSSITKAMQPILLLMVVGILISAWIAGGIVQSMIYYGLMILRPGIFLVASCLVCCIVALATGSSWTTAGTIGIALIGIGQGLGINPAMIAGAIVSGAYFGDKMSPLSDTTNLAPAVAGANLFDHIRHMMWTVTPSLVIALIIYAFLGIKTAGAESDMGVVTAMQQVLKANYYISPVLLIPPVIIIVMVAFKIPAIPGMVAGVVMGCICGSLLQGVHLIDWIDILHYGYEYSFSDAFNSAGDAAGQVLSDLGNGEFTTLAASKGLSDAVVAEYNLGSLLTRGGMDSMLWTINLIICAMCFGGVMESSGMLARVAESLLKAAKTNGMLVIITIVTCFIMNMIAADQFLAIILPGSMYKETFEDRRLKPKNLSRCLEDSATITSALIPWTTCGATMTKVLGVPTGMYWRYAFLNIVNPFVSIFYGITGISMEKMTEEEYQQILEKREEERRKAAEELMA